MPGIFGAAAAEPRRHPARIAEGMADRLTHQQWYGRLLHRHHGTVIGAVSASPWFSGEHRLAARPEARLLVEGTAFTIDGVPHPDDMPGLSSRLLDLYLESPDAFPARLGGHFNLAVEDSRTGALQLINDRLGFAHLYWYADEEIFLFAPELKAFLCWRGFDRELDEGAFGSLLAGQCPLGTRTLFRRASMLAPASRLTWHQGRVTVERYWRPEPSPELGRSDEEVVEQALALYRRSLDKRIPSAWEGRVVIPLSGGLDSRLLLWMARGHGDRLDLFTHGQAGCTDAVIARQIAGALELEHRHRLVAIDPDWAGEHARLAVWLNDGQLNLRNATLIGISEAVGPEPVPFLNGIIGAFMSLGVGGFVGRDELAPLTDPGRLRRKALAVAGLTRGREALRRVMPGKTADRLLDQAEDQAWEAFEELGHVELFGDRKILFVNGNPGRRMQGTVDVHRYYFHDLLPFVDEELAAFWLSIPLADRLGNRLYHEMYRRRLPDLARVPWSHTGLDLFAPAEAARAAAEAKSRKLHRLRLLSKYSLGRLSISSSELYLHREVWLRRNRVFRGLMKSTLRSVNGTGCPWFDQRRVDRLFRRFDLGGDHHLRMLMQVATVVIWHDQFLGQPSGFDLEDG